MRRDERDIAFITFSELCRAGLFGSPFIARGNGDGFLYGAMGGEMLELGLPWGNDS